MLSKSGQRVVLECAARKLEGEGPTRLLVLTHDITEHKEAREKLKRSLDALLALHEASQILVSSLVPEEVGRRLLEIMQRLCGLSAVVIYLRDEQRLLQTWQTTGPESIWDWAGTTPVVNKARSAALRTKRPELFYLDHSDLGGSAPLVGLYLPLWVGEEDIGLLEAYGPQSLAEKDTVRVLESLASQAASALENARLYGVLAERERRLAALVGRLIASQEEERRRVAYDVHDSLAQAAGAVHRYLQTFAHHHPQSSPQDQEELEGILKLAKQTVGEARRIIANLRPTVLDNFGLDSAVRFQVEQLRSEGWQVSYEAALGGDERLPSAVETALFRVAQEALTNVRKHAHSARLHLALLRLGAKVRLQVRDFGHGFDPSAPGGRSDPSEGVGFSSMREQVSLVGGELKVQSRAGIGTLVVADVPLAPTADATMHEPVQRP